MNLVDIFQRAVRVRKPGWARTPEAFFTMMTQPSTPRWEYEPRGPFQLIRFDMVDPTIVYGYDDQTSLDVLLAEFARLHLPRVNEGCTILDCDHQAVLGWIFSADGCDWCGCAKVFLELEKYVDPMDVAWWRRSAQENDMRETMEAAHERA
jgi:hypothetical protein